ncbi:hypothetical protein SAMN05443270_3930 [Lacrimispora sphenoides]|uniref:DNA-binding protein n=1 Tax=Lacrimispora sphenoides TaxID=29370 RepID=UPI0008BB7BEE|nr:DNA-binding protein [Lacrimispora sphenoides]SEU25116.1 hypothetical protein SAMN05443270_3930 [Lacrimispora sphenoides]
MLDYISVRQVAGKWGISERRIQKLCEEKRIVGAIRFGHARAIPKMQKSLQMQKEKKRINV